MTETRSRRSYNSPRRAAGAEATRRTVLDAAAELFLQRGYTATTLTAVAGRAGVSLATVKLIAPTKAGLMLQVAYARARGDADPAPLPERPHWAEMLSAPTAAEVLRRFVAISARAHQRQARLFEVIWQAAPAHPELAEALRRGADSRRADYRGVVEELRRRGALRSDLDPETAVEITWAVNSPQLFRLFADQRWSLDRWERWLLETLGVQLLAGPL
jgi:AcrR family transcriptional regulator